MIGFRKDYKEAVTIPKHKCMQLVANCEQNISALTSRRLLTYEKIAEHSGDYGTDQVIESVGDFRSKYEQHALKNLNCLDMNWFAFAGFSPMKKKPVRNGEYARLKSKRSDARKH